MEVSPRVGPTVDESRSLLDSFFGMSLRVSRQGVLRVLNKVSTQTPLNNVSLFFVCVTVSRLPDVSVYTNVESGTSFVGVVVRDSIQRVRTVTPVNPGPTIKRYHTLFNGV